jgi:cysteine desulfurase
MLKLIETKHQLSVLWHHQSGTQLEKLTNNNSSRVYLDYNATSPLAPSVREWLAKGDFYFGNPASVHSTGKRSKRAINETIDFLFRATGLSNKDFNLFFHSGATEGINALCRGLATKCLEKNEKFYFFYANTDHSAVHRSADEIARLGFEIHALKVDKNGDLLLDEAIGLINSCQDGTKLFNFTTVNNESGVVWPLELAKIIKEKTGCLIHVDAVQAPGKIENSLKLMKEIDAYTFSAHKFGAMKAVGFSFVKTDFQFVPLVRGGGQQGGLRSGTENPDGVYSIKLALEYLIEHLKIDELRAAKDEFEQKILEVIKDKNLIASYEAKNRNANTIYIVLPKQKTDVLLTAFDLAGFDLSSGSACSSGAILPSQVLMSMGFNEDKAKSALRISLSPYTNRNDLAEFTEKFLSVLKRFV